MIFFFDDTDEIGKMEIRASGDISQKWQKMTKINKNCMRVIGLIDGMTLSILHLFGVSIPVARVKGSYKKTAFSVSES